MKRLRSNSDILMISLRKIIQVIDQNSRSLYKRIGLTGPQLIILQEIEFNAGMFVGELAREVSLSQATVTSILERLENRGLIGRRRSDNDRRRVLLHATDEGKKLIKEAPPLMPESFAERFNQMPEWEQTMILSSLQRLAGLMTTGIN